MQQIHLNQTQFLAKMMTGIDPNSKTSAAKTMQLFSGFVSEHVSLCLLYASNIQGSFHTSLPCLASLFAYNACREHKLSIETVAPALVQGKDWLVPRRTLGMRWQARLIMSNQLHSSAPLQQKKKILEKPGASKNETIQGSETCACDWIRNRNQ